MHLSERREKVVKVLEFVGIPWLKKASVAPSDGVCTTGMHHIHNKPSLNFGQPLFRITVDRKIRRATVFLGKRPGGHDVSGTEKIGVIITAPSKVGRCLGAMG